MLRSPPPGMAMRLAEERRHDLPAAAGKEPATFGGIRPFLRTGALVAGLARRAMQMAPPAIRTSTADILRRTRLRPSSQAEDLA
jgi:hypothetical protein